MSSAAIPGAAPHGAPFLDPPPLALVALVVAALPGALVAAAVALGLLDATVAFYAFVPSFVGLNAMHMAATWTRVHLAPGFATARRGELVLVPCALGAMALALEAIGHARVLFVLQAALSLHHAAMQNYGLARADQRRTGRQLEGAALRLDQAVCVLPLFAALAYRARTVSPLYDGALLPSLPEAVVVALGAMAVLALVAFAIRETLAWRRGEAPSGIALGTTLGVTLAWVLLLVFVADPVVPFFALASGHYVQYLWVSVRTERARAQSLGTLPPSLRAHVDARSPWRFLAFLALFGAAGISAVTLVAIVARALAVLAGFEPDPSLALPPWGAAMLAVNLHHYWLDHRIWRGPR